MQPCKLCNRPTETVVNIRLKAVPVCEACCLGIAKQTVSGLVVETTCPDGKAVSFIRGYLQREEPGSR